MTRIVPLAYAVTGLVVYLLSGRAEGLISLRGGLILLAALASPVALFLAGRFLFRLAKGAVGARRAFVDSGLVLGGLLVFALFIYVSAHLDDRLERMTMRQGDELVAAIEKFRGVTGRYPASLDELRAAGYRVPMPALMDSEFTYRAFGDGAGDPQVSFGSTLFRACWRDLNGVAWWCTD
jgi:hypothetical protein